MKTRKQMKALAGLLGVYALLVAGAGVFVAYGLAGLAGYWFAYS